MGEALPGLAEESNITKIPSPETCRHSSGFYHLGVVEITLA